MTIRLLTNSIRYSVIFNVLMLPFSTRYKIYKKAEDRASTITKILSWTEMLIICSVAYFSVRMYVRNGILIIVIMVAAYALSSILAGACDTILRKKILRMLYSYFRDSERF